jgi:2-polyprenyl-3-methyl-5-hydroxy-6-metoxy-1,4-benzoquinol methylase
MLAPAEHVPCNLCGADDGEPVLTKHGFTIVRCRGCSLAYVTPRPSAAALAALYGDERYYRNLNASPFGYPDYLGQRWLLERLVERRLDEIERRVGGRGRLLDVGCATGVLVEAACRRGWSAVGVDISAFATAQCHHRGLDVRHGDLMTAELPREHFDVAVLDDTIEHLGDPGRALSQIRGALKPGGLVTLNTPNDAGWLRRVMGKHWFHCKPPEHLYYFSPRTLRALLERHGFHRVETRLSGKYVTVRYLCDRTKAYGVGVARALSGTIGRLPGADTPFALPIGEFVTFAERPGA